MKALNIFMYHRVLPEPAAGAVSVSMLRRQLRYLRSHYQLLTCDKLIAWLDGTLQTDRSCAAVTFDDGWYDNFLYATPVLKECGVQGIVAWSSGFLHDAKNRATPEKDAGQPSEQAYRNALYNNDRSAFLTAGEVREMSESGVWNFQAHGARHVRHFKSLEPHRKTYPAFDDFSLPYALDNRPPRDGLPVGNLVSALAWPKTRGPDEPTGDLRIEESRDEYTRRIKAELEQNIRDIETCAGKRPLLLFWPWGDYSDESVEAARQAGFKYTFSVEKGGISPRSGDYVLPRIGVSENWSKFVRNSFIFRHPLLGALHSSRSRFHHIEW